MRKPAGFSIGPPDGKLDLGHRRARPDLLDGGFLEGEAAGWIDPVLDFRAGRDRAEETFEDFVTGGDDAGGASAVDDVGGAMEELEVARLGSGQAGSALAQLPFECGELGAGVALAFGETISKAAERGVDLSEFFSAKVGAYRERVGGACRIVSPQVPGEGSQRLRPRSCQAAGHPPGERDSSEQQEAGPEREIAHSVADCPGGGRSHHGPAAADEG